MQRLVKMMRLLLPLLLVALVLTMVSGQPAQAQAPSTDQRILSVTGHGREHTPMTIAQISFGVSARGDNAKAAYGSVEKRSAALVKFLQGQDVMELNTSSVNLTPQSDRSGQLKKATYDGYQTVAFQVPADRIGLLDDAIAVGVDNLNPISFIAPETVILKAREGALKKAMADAKSQANVALSTLDSSIQEIVDIQVGDANIQTPDVQLAQRQDSSYSSWRTGLPLIAGGDQTVDVQVTLKIRY